MTDTVEASQWPVNELGEIVLRRGTGTKAIVGGLNSVPVHPIHQTASYVDASQHGDWAFVQDGRYLQGTPLAVADGVKTKLDFDFTQIAFSAGSGLAINYNPTTDTFMPTTLGDVFLTNLRAKIIPTSQAGTVDITLESPTVSFNPIVADTLTFNKASGQVHFHSVFQTVFISQFLIDNGLEIYIKPINTNITIYDYSIFLQKTYAGVND